MNNKSNIKDHRASLFNPSSPSSPSSLHPLPSPASIHSNNAAPRDSPPRKPALRPQTTDPCAPSSAHRCTTRKLPITLPSILPYIPLAASARTAPRSPPNTPTTPQTAHSGSRSPRSAAKTAHTRPRSPRLTRSCAAAAPYSR